MPIKERIAKIVWKIIKPYCEVTSSDSLFLKSISLKFSVFGETVYFMDIDRVELQDRTKEI